MFLCQIVLYDENPSEIQCYFDISTLEKIEETFNRLEEQYQNKNGIIMVGVILSSKIDMNINLCCNETLLHYYNAEKEPHHLVSVRDKNTKSDEVIKFWVATAHEWTKLPKRHLIHQEQARHAIRYFVQTEGQLTAEIIWENPIPELNIEENHTSKLNDDSRKNTFDIKDKEVPF